MEAKEGESSGGFTAVGSEAPTDYHIAPRNENHAGTGAGNPCEQQVVGSTPGTETQVALQQPATSMKKKRGRPRKYGPDGGVTVALSAKPISASAPAPAGNVIDFSAEKRPKMKPAGPIIKQHQQPKIESENFGGEWVSCSVGANFTPHIITVNAGEDVTMKGRFEILSLTGSFTPSESGGIRNRSGGMSVSLASPDGRVVGGGVAGLLVAASPVQIVVGSFLSGNQHEQKPKKEKFEYIISGPPTSTVHFSNTRMHESYEGQGYHTASGTTYKSFQGDTRNGSGDHNASLHED